MVFTLLIWSACQPPSSSGDEPLSGSPTGVGEIFSAASVCYLHTHGRDSVKLSVNLDQDSIEGVMHFRNYQIDGSRGTVRGRFHGDTLFVFYDFFAEGTHNITEEAFLKSGDTYIRGFGEREEIEGVYQFKNRKNIDFSEGQVFLPVHCTDGFGEL